MLLTVDLETMPLSLAGNSVVKKNLGCDSRAKVMVKAQLFGVSMVIDHKYRISENHHYHESDLSDCRYVSTTL